MNDFEEARLAGLVRLQERQGIGTLGERSLHSILKYWIDPDDSHHEKTLGLGRIVADVFDGKRITEIQTRNFHTLRPKLDRMLPHYPVTVLYPVAKTKRLIWVNPETGESTAPRKSPKTGSVWEVFPELYRIRSYLTQSQLTIQIVFLELEEYKLLNGWSKDKKKGSCRMERIPTALCETIELCGVQDYVALLPKELPRPFGVADLSKLIQKNKRMAGLIINVLYTMNAIIRTGKRGNAFLYEPAVAEK